MLEGEKGEKREELRDTFLDHIGTKSFEVGSTFT